MSGANSGGSATVYFEKSSQEWKWSDFYILSFCLSHLMKNVFAKVAALSVMQCGVASFAC